LRADSAIQRSFGVSIDIYYPWPDIRQRRSTYNAEAAPNVTTYAAKFCRAVIQDLAVHFHHYRKFQVMPTKIVVNFALALLILGIAGTISACNTVAGFGEDVQAGGKGIQKGAQKTKNAM
jgi:predicted small secreted protein